jgi:uncharacterized protein (TIGR03083 family)
VPEPRFSKSDLRRIAVAERRRIHRTLKDLTDDQWAVPSLCEGWAVRDVVGHILYGNELKLWTLPWKLARFGFSSDRSGKHYSAERAKGQTPQQLVVDFDARNPWAGTCKVFPARLTLLHHQDIRRPLDRPRDIPEERLVAVLDATPQLGSVFGAKRRTKNLRFEATDVDWSWGTGPAVSGPAEALFMAMLGRTAAAQDLTGEGLDQFRSRLS